MTRRHLTFRWGLLVLLGTATRNAHAQRLVQTEAPQPFQMRITDKYVQTDVEFEHELQGQGTPDSSIRHQRMIVEPVVGLGLGGSVYHPNLLQYQLKTELGTDWQDSRATPGGQTANARFLQRYHGSLDFLQQKPYATSVFADKDMSYRDYDFFSRVRVESERYGARSGYTEGAVPFTVSAQHYDESVADPSRPTQLSEDTINLNAQSQRRQDRARTTLSYNLDQFSRQDDGYGTQKGLNQNVNLLDSETFGDDGWVTLNSLLNYNSITETIQPTDRMLFQENFRLEHSEKLKTFYEYAFDTQSAGSADSTTQQGRVGLSYHPMESFSSTFDLHRVTSDSSSPGNWSAASRNGLSFDAQYSKPVGRWGALTLGYSGQFDREERSTTGQAMTVLREKHALSDGATTFLSQPNVLVISSVTDGDHTTYFEGTDYRVTQRGLLTQIERVPGGRIPNPGVVYVDYTAAPPASAAYNSLNNTVNFRFDLWSGLLGFYGRWTSLSYDGADVSLLRWLNDKTVGVDSTWRWLRTGAEYEVADSNMAPFDRMRFFQSVQVQAGENGTLGLDLDQNWAHYHDTGQRQNSYGVIARYQQRLTENLAWNVEGGLRKDRGHSFDRDVGVGRVGLDWTVGKMTIRVGYEHNSESQPTSLSERHYFHIRIRRTF